MLWTKTHMKMHKVSNIKLVQILPNKNNADEDCFVLVPKEGYVPSSVCFTFKPVQGGCSTTLKKNDVIVSHLVS